MPYIKYARRVELVESMKPEGSGEMNFMVTQFMIDFMMAEEPDEYIFYAQLWRLASDYLLNQEEMKYLHINLIMGAFVCAYSEFRRRLPANRQDTDQFITLSWVVEKVMGDVYNWIAVPYENEKMIENGDVYPDELTQI